MPGRFKFERDVMFIPLGVGMEIAIFACKACGVVAVAMKPRPDGVLCPFCAKVMAHGGKLTNQPKGSRHLALVDAGEVGEHD